MSSRHSIGLAAVAFAALASPILAQESSLERDVTFVRNLATKLRFIELAQSEAERLQKTHLESDNFKLVSQLGIEISLIGARAHPIREERRTLFKEALDKSSDFIERYSSEPVGDDARVTMVQACVQYGEFLNEEIELARQEAPDQVKELEEGAAEVYRNGIEVCNEFLSRNEGNDDMAQKYYYCWLNKGILQRENARAVRADREALASLARETFEELILEIGEESLLGLRGYFEMSRIGEVEGDYATAVSDYQSTIESITIALDSAEELQISGWVREQLLDLMQEAYRYAADALLKDGKVDGVLALVNEFRTNLVNYGGDDENADAFEIASPDQGHGVFLTEARAMAESGEADKISAALAQVKRINDVHPNDIIGIRAKAILSEIMSLPSAGDVITGATLFEVAKGDYQSREYEAAVRGFKRAHSAMSEDERKKLGLELWNLMGRAYGVQKRYAEASLAFANALEKYGQYEEGPVEAVADSLDRAWAAYLFSTKRDTDPAIRTLTTRINSILTRFGGTANAAKRLWKDGTNAMRQKKWQEALGYYTQIATDSPYYEPAQARRVTCLQQLKKYDEARKVRADYLAWLETPAANIPADDKSGQAARRATAMAGIAYADISMSYDAANPAEGTKDPTKFPEILTSLENFYTKHAGVGESYFPMAYNMQARLHCELGQIEKAEETYRKLKNEFAGSLYIPSLATRIFQAHGERVKGFETEYASQLKSDDKDMIRSTLDKLQTARRAALKIGVEYAANSPKPAYGMMSTTLGLAKDLADWPTVEQVGKQMREVFASSKSNNKKVQRYVVPAIGESLLRQKKLRDAEKVLREAIETNPKDYASKRLLALVLGGWVDLDERLVQIEELGLGKPAEAYDLMFIEYRKYVRAKVADFSLDWYRFMWESYLFAVRSIPKDTKYKGYAGTLYRKADGNERFETLKTLGPEGNRLYQLFIANPPPR